MLMEGRTATEQDIHARRADGVPAEELAVENTVLRPGIIELTVRNHGPDTVSIAQAQVNDAFAAQRRGEADWAPAVGDRALQQPWVEGEA